MNPDHIQSLVTIRSLVAALGETHQWWRSTFLSPTGLRFLQRIYPRTFVAAGIRSASEAARIDHDARIGRGQVVHLFRLPAALERAIDDTLRGWGVADQQKIEGMLTSSEGSITELRRLAEGARSSGGEGPVACGGASRLQEPQAVGLLAAEYLEGFGGGKRVYPYFEVGK
jgi:hypothetical protein